MSKIAIIYLGVSWINCPSLRYEEIIPSVYIASCNTINELYKAR
jgi:hypothetical protein